MWKEIDNERLSSTIENDSIKIDENFISSHDSSINDSSMGCIDFAVAECGSLNVTCKKCQFELTTQKKSQIDHLRIRIFNLTPVK